MKVTKYPQSCLLLEKDGHRLLIDPGSHFTARYSSRDIGTVETVLITHHHGDHFDPKFISGLVSEGVSIYGNTDTCAQLEGIKQIKSGEGFSVPGFTVMPHDLPHCRVPKVYGDVQNTGYVIDGTFFHPGDGVETSGVTVHDAAVPVAGPDISFYDAMELIKSIGAKRVIPIHYNDHHNLANLDHFKLYADEAEAEVIALGDGQSVEL